MSQRVAALDEHNRLLTIAATERAQKLQDREAELTQALAVMSQRVAALDEHNRLLTIAATERAQKLQDREAELTQALAVMSQRVAALDEHNRLLTIAATQRAQKLQDREAELTQALAVMSQRVAALDEHNRLLTIAATERAQKLQDREAELTQALAVMSQRVERLSKHNQWLTEGTIDALREFLDSDIAIRHAVTGQLLDELEQTNRSIQESMPQQGMLLESDRAESHARELSCESCAPASNSLDGTRRYCEAGGQRPHYLPRQKHVLMVTSVIALGGCERLMLSTADGLIHRGYQTEIFCFGAAPDEANFMAEFSRLGIKCRHAFDTADSMVDDGQDTQILSKFARLVDHLDVPSIGKALGRVIREFRPEIVHCWGDFANVIGGLVSCNLGVPRIVLEQVNLPLFRHIDGPEPCACRDGYRLLASNANVVMFNNSLAGAVGYAKWLGVPKDKIKVLYNGFLPNGIHIRRQSEAETCRRQLGLPSDTPVVGAIMRFAAEKDPILWLETAAMVAAARPHTNFVLAGYGELEEVIRRTIQELGLGDRFVLPGATKDIGLIYGALDVFLMTSRFEGSPNVLIEAQAAGIPVVAPNVGGIDETLSDGATGIVVGNRRPLSFASAVLQILDDPSWQKRAALRGPIFVAERFGHQRMIDETIAVYRSTV
jgi:glycosyltransferase involved in cell wall biosynthesis